MPLSNLLKSAAGTCPFCNQKASILSREHPDCRRTFQAGRNEMVEPTGNFSYDENFNSIGIRWSETEGDGTKGYEPHYENYRRLPEGVFVLGMGDEAQPLEDHLRRGDKLLFLAGQVTTKRGYCKKIDLVHNFLLRGTRAVDGFLDRMCANDVMNAWTLARVLIERCIWLGYILRKDKVEEFYEYSAFEVKKWAYRAASLDILDLESVEDFDEDMEDELGHTLGKPAPQWNQLGVNEMCRETFDKPLSERIYNLYQLASMSTHPGMDDSGEYFIAVEFARLRTYGSRHDANPRGEVLKLVAEVFAMLIELAETPLIEAAKTVYHEDEIQLFMKLRVEPPKIRFSSKDSPPCSR